MTIVTLPNNWKPRKYQLKAWGYLENGGKHAELIWPRRHGKDDLSLHWTAVALHMRVGSYWHMLPEAAQARKAIWSMVNPHTGKRRIDEAFPLSLRSTTREQEMQIVFKNGSTWQLVGSDNFNSLVGSSPAGIVYSEWALADPAAKAFLRPIIAENNGWQIFITTPRGKNHAYQTFKAAEKNPKAFAESLTALDSGTFTIEQLDEIRQGYIDDYGLDMGNALFEQEYMSNFEAAILGSVWGADLRQIEEVGRYTTVAHDKNVVVHTAWDLGRSDYTVIWFYQMIGSELHIIDCYKNCLKDVEHYHDLLCQKRDERGFKYSDFINIPHDARAKTLASKRSVEEQMNALGWKTRIVPNLSLNDGINAVRKVLKNAWVDSSYCENGWEAIKQYQYEWDDKKKIFTTNPKHDWTSHYADALRYLAICCKEVIAEKVLEKPKFALDLTISQMIERNAQKRKNSYD